MKMTKIMVLLLATVALAACGSGDAEPNEAELQQQLAVAAQIGQAQAIAEIIERSMAEPCQPINLFNNQDPENLKEVNLINIACESLDLPKIPAAPAEGAEAPVETEAVTE